MDKSWINWPCQEKIFMKKPNSIIVLLYILIVRNRGKEFSHSVFWGEHFKGLVTGQTLNWLDTINAISASNIAFIICIDWILSTNQIFIVSLMYNYNSWTVCFAVCATLRRRVWLFTSSHGRTVCVLVGTQQRLGGNLGACSHCDCCGAHWARFCNDRIHRSRDVSTFHQVQFLLLFAYACIFKFSQPSRQVFFRLWQANLDRKVLLLFYQGSTNFFMPTFFHIWRNNRISFRLFQTEALRFALYSELVSSRKPTTCRWRVLSQSGSRSDTFLITQSALVIKKKCPLSQPVSIQ